MRWSAAQRREAEALDIVLYDKPLEPPRGAVPGPDGGSPRLAFKGEKARAAFVRDCKRQVAGSCEQGARAACAVKAVRHCSGPVWLRWLGLGRAGKSWEEQEACEAAQAAACMAEAAPQCAGHAESFCELVAERDRRGVQLAPAEGGGARR
ncbi:hypothetical protein Rsub_12543 [Raphidocelis subcapitata]|uniref:Uncharacterized protein n=1 Tax=Raphidocelis subcapitata TaxID=307507 RepID=A0A2V0PNY1_9CHLO|nr:hypothetical protein Rsub_12543 [Raphidocelis subcapitata]|eukprot:GBF99843.1 hypothetical protein Rsub_12543 [Raphidocelis subcapitata]